jgi:hypothetical protein
VCGRVFRLDSKARVEERKAAEALRRCRRVCEVWDGGSWVRMTLRSEGVRVLYGGSLRGL